MVHRILRSVFIVAFLISTALLLAWFQGTSPRTGPELYLLVETETVQPGIVRVRLQGFVPWRSFDARARISDLEESRRGDLIEARLKYSEPRDIWLMDEALAPPLPVYAPWMLLETLVELIAGLPDLAGVVGVLILVLHDPLLLALSPIAVGWGVALLTYAALLGAVGSSASLVLATLAALGILALGITIRLAGDAFAILALTLTALLLASPIAAVLGWQVWFVRFMVLLGALAGPGVAVLLVGGYLIVLGVGSAEPMTVSVCYVAASAVLLMVTLGGRGLARAIERAGSRVLRTVFPFFQSGPRQSLEGAHRGLNR
jgi:hypothetical protein